MSKYWILVLLCVILSVKQLLTNVEAARKTLHIRKEGNKNLTTEMYYLKNLVWTKTTYTHEKKGTLRAKMNVLGGIYVPDENGRNENVILNWKRETPPQKIQMIPDEEVETDETIRLTFSEKERKDGFKITRPEDSPFAVLVIVMSSSYVKSLCSGSLLTSRWVLTAAHCLDDSDYTTSVRVYAGGNSFEEVVTRSTPATSQQRDVKKFFTHPYYDSRRKVENDVAVLEMNEEFRKTRYVSTVGLFKREWNSNRYKACVLTGFGKVYFEKKDPEDYFRKTHYLEVKKGCPCFEDTAVDEVITCSRPRDDYGPCKGDSGGGLVCGRKVVAVVSAMMTVEDIATCNLNKSKVQECGLKNTLSVFLDVGPYLDWISSTMNKNTDGSDLTIYSGTTETSGRLCSMALVLFPFVLRSFFSI